MKKRRILDKILESEAGGYNTGVGASHTDSSIGSIGSIPSGLGTYSMSNNGKRKKKKPKKNDKYPFGNPSDYTENETPEMLKNQNKKLNNIINSYSKNK